MSQDPEATAQLLRYQRCLACGAAQTLRRFACVRCGHEHLQWNEACGRGIVHAITVVSRAPSEEFRGLAPYALLLVTLEEGPRVMGHGLPGMAIGQPVLATFFEHAGRPLICFRPV